MNGELVESSPTVEQTEPEHVNTTTPALAASSSSSRLEWLEHEFGAARTALKVWESRWTQQHDELTTARRELQDAKEHISSLQLQLVSRLAHAAKDAQCARQDADAFKSRIRDLEEQRHKLSLDGPRVRALEAQVATLEADLDASRQTVKALRHANAEAHASTPTHVVLQRVGPVTVEAPVQCNIDVDVPVTAEERRAVLKMRELEEREQTLRMWEDALLSRDVEMELVQRDRDEEMFSKASEVKIIKMRFQSVLEELAQCQKHKEEALSAEAEKEELRAHISRLEARLHAVEQDAQRKLIAADMAVRTAQLRSASIDKQLAVLESQTEVQCTELRQHVMGRLAEAAAAATPPVATSLERLASPSVHTAHSVARPGDPYDYYQPQHAPTLSRCGAVASPMMSPVGGGGDKASEPSCSRHEARSRLIAIDDELHRLHKESIELDSRRVAVEAKHAKAKAEISGSSDRRLVEHLDSTLQRFISEIDDSRARIHERARQLTQEREDATRATARPGNKRTMSSPSSST